MLNMLTDVDDSKLVECTDSSSESSLSDVEEDEIDSVPSLLVSDVYSESEQGSVTGILISDSKTDE